ncbi:MAG: CIA30 family protein [Thiomicrorhabdus chilensis]|uniref:CIA30 family protein n=1 Tax=Thiomicrorhabdus chilensis TaxID=63656 RepID=UPI00299D43A3|nr:CIA30 family protein [Thiomicrorhabdus chilensis]MDX1347592.1 CIA30 family protein [Thiomicrorhabdus chilensis]
MSQVFYELFDQSKVGDSASDHSWRFVGDQVMGGLSSGLIDPITIDGVECVCLSGNVSVANNGGFIQMAWDFSEEQAAHAQQFDGLYLDVIGNGEGYNLHLRTSQLWLPWQSFRSGFRAGSGWQRLLFPFSEFQSYRTYARLNVSKLKRIGVVAIGREFEAQVCVRSFGFYSQS